MVVAIANLLQCWPSMHEFGLKCEMHVDLYGYLYKKNHKRLNEVKSINANLTSNRLDSSNMERRVNVINKSNRVLVSSSCPMIYRI
jgi:hypothetical protein